MARETSPSASSLHIFKGHSRRVTSLERVKSKESYFISASLDGKLKIWCTEKMIELYCFDMSLNSPVINSAQGDTICNVKLLSDKVYALVFRQYTEIGLISHLAQAYFMYN